MIPLRFQLCCICVTQLRRRRPKPQTVWRGFRRCVCLIQVMPVWFVCFCPASHACHHGHSSLGEFRTEKEARNKIVHHLRHSSCHNMSLALAEQMGLDATIDEEYREDCDPKGKGKGTVDGAVHRHRHEPYGGEWGGSSSSWTASGSLDCGAMVTAGLWAVRECSYAVGTGTRPLEGGNGSFALEFQIWCPEQ